MSANQTMRNIVRLLRSKQASNFFINGPPGAGKSYLLRYLSQQLPGQISGMGNVFGPYNISANDLPWTGQSLLESLWNSGYLKINPSYCQVNDLANVWHWIESNSAISQRQTFIILIDLPYLNDDNLITYCDFLSNVRSLEATWQSEQIGLCHILAGFWDSERVKAYAQQTGISFPYTEGENYFYWRGIEAAELAALVRASYPEVENVPIIQDVLYEITDGNPELTKKILSNLPDNVLTFSNVITASKTVAENSSALLAKSTQHLNEKIKRLLGNLLIDQYLPSHLYTTYRNRLLLSGLVKEELLGQETYIRFRSWFYEIMVRLHGHDMGIPQEFASKVRIGEMMPSIRSLNQELYRLINDIETQARNFLVIQLSLHRDENQPLLNGFLEEIRSGSIVDAHQRAEEWRDRASQSKAFNDLNPIVSYLSTRDLANIIKELSSLYKVGKWHNIGQALSEMANIRDAVMHNQLVDDSAIHYLYNLQIQIYSALNLK